MQCLSDIYFILIQKNEFFDAKELEECVVRFATFILI